MDGDSNWSVSGESVSGDRLLLTGPHESSLVLPLQAKTSSHRLVSQTRLTLLSDCEYLNPLEVGKRIIGLSER